MSPCELIYNLSPKYSYQLHRSSTQRSSITFLRSYRENANQNDLKNKFWYVFRYTMEIKLKNGIFSTLCPSEAACLIYNDLFIGASTV